MSYKKVLLASISIMAICPPAVLGESLLVEAEGFDSHGGWSLDPQFMQGTMFVKNRKESL